MNNARSVRRTLRHALTVIVLAMPLVALAETPIVEVFAVPDEGDGPLDVDIHVRASNPHNERLYCKLSYVGDDGPFDVHNRFIIDPPFDELVFSYTYDASRTDYHPTVICQGNGVSSDTSPVTVRESADNAMPAISLAGPASAADAGYPVLLTVVAHDPDGDTLHCSVDYGEFGVESESFVIEPPYDDFVLSHRFGPADLYMPEVLCRDDRGASARASTRVDVVMSPGNRIPSFVLRRLNSMTGEAPRTVGYQVASISDADGNVLSCHFDARDGLGRRPFTVAPPYNSVNFSARYTRELEMDFPVVTCTDGHGGYRAEQNFISVLLGSGNLEPTASVVASSESGLSPLDVIFTVAASDPNGDALNCELSYGFAEGGETFQVAPGDSPATFSHRYRTRDSYQAAIDCREDRGGHTQEAVWIEVDPLQEPGNYEPIMRLDASRTAGDASLSVSFFVNGSDPDGDDVACTLDFGDGTAPRSIALAAPLYSQQWVPHTYYTARRDPYRAVLSCADGQGGASTKVADIQVDRPASAAMPVIAAFAAAPAMGDAPLNVSFDLSVNDSDSYQVNCNIDYGDGSSYTVVSLVPFSIRRSHQYAGGSYSARVYCCDDVGFGGQCGPDNLGMATAAQSIEALAPNGNPVVDLEIGAPLDGGLLEVSFAVAGLDPDGDELSCTLDPGDGNPAEQFILSQPYEPMLMPHAYDYGATYVASLECADGRGGVSADQLVFLLNGPGASGMERVIDPDEAVDDGHVSVHRVMR